MRQFDVFENESARSRERAPYLLALPGGYFLDRRTVIAPLIGAELLKPVQRLNPRFEIEGAAVLLSPLEIVNILTSELRRLVQNLEPERTAIAAALDLLFTGI
ncbi:CcdB family protein [Flaviflagellibacter deserti]|uniref:Toxin CcdB n=1 Tax=Flaviflagellibacter deserti TaxID=2267266 RepID=A0ABV9Z6U2_9HYPH